MTSRHRVLTSTPDDRGRPAARAPRREFIEQTPANRPPGDGHGQAGVASGYINPSEVLRDAKLPVQQKRNLLRQWAFDAYCMEVPTTDDVPASAPSRLDEAIDALIDLDEATTAAAVCEPARMSVKKADRRGQAA